MVVETCSNVQPEQAGRQVCPFTAAEYFAGIGLVRLGLEKAGWQVVFANDISAQKYEMYSAFFQDMDGEYKVQDVHLLRPEQVPPTVLATASFPCIDLSLAGNMAGLGGEHSGAFWGFVRILRLMEGKRPPLILLENVLGWLSSDHGRDFTRAIQALNELGYTCDAFVLNAQHFTPQSRPRLFVVGARFRAGEEDVVPRMRSRPKPLCSQRLQELLAQNPGLSWMVLDLPAPPPLKHNLGSIIEPLPENDVRWWPEDKVTHLVGQMSDKHRTIVQELVAREETSFATVYKRVRQGATRAEVRTDGAAGCLRTPVGGSSKQVVLVAGNGQLRVRWMTGREYARLQGTPDNYPINVPYLQALWGFGDAVCVPAITWVARNALNPLAAELSCEANDG